MSFERATTPGSLTYRLGSILHENPSPLDCRQAVTAASELLAAQTPGKELAALDTQYINRTSVTLPEFKIAVGAIGILAALPDPVDQAPLQVLRQFTASRLKQADDLMIDADTAKILKNADYDKLQELSHQPYSYQTGLIYNLIRYPLIAEAVATMIADPDFSPADFRADMYALNHDLATQPPVLATVPIPRPTEATGYDFLAADDFHAATEPDRSGTAVTRPTLSEADRERLRYLGKLHTLWDPSRPPQIAAVSLESDGTKDHWLLILERIIADGAHKQTLILESAQPNTATYIIPEEAVPDNTNWQALFPTTRRRLRQAGAYKRTHGPNHEYNVLDSITSPPASKT